jgi:hypothetical protein
MSQRIRDFAVLSATPPLCRVPGVVLGADLSGINEQSIINNSVCLININESHLYVTTFRDAGFQGAKN